MSVRSNGSPNGEPFEDVRSIELDGDVASVDVEMAGLTDLNEVKEVTINGEQVDAANDVAADVSATDGTTVTVQFYVPDGGGAITDYAGGNGVVSAGDVVEVTAEGY